MITWELIIAIDGLILGWVTFQEMRLRQMHNEIKERLQEQRVTITREQEELKESIHRVESKLDTLTMMLVNLQLKDMSDASKKD